ncbi:hypothetical protein BGZ61DRAFT_455003 [Ilyonectria robusta]|uniref:uncharacterized protein n=1 Tax=Ilyonectria robusta TaxID=1079257 RepID=UPI001E8CB9FB|nr:uncharacterized protein BGZ61DRAFT_455003 [Ilyonectria robusta]KAH8685154.1 hypothetical protein BGZ61DRAFT_455003 [Ilyonectria robusta]
MSFTTILLITTSRKLSKSDRSPLSPGWFIDSVAWSVPQRSCNSSWNLPPYLRTVL